MRTTVAALLITFVALPAVAQQTDDLNRVIDEGLNHSQVMQTAEHPMDSIGSRMTNSPGMRQAEAWTQSQFKSWGLKNVRKDGFALWAGEEQGLLGSRSYIEKYLATRPPAPSDVPQSWAEQNERWPTRFPITPRPGYKDLVAYFNIDNGSGKIRGIHAEGNVAATGGTDHEWMQAIGVPAYQFIQDPLDYGSRVHHGGVDTFDHLKAEDLRQASVVLAGLLLESANSARTLPRMGLPTTPTPTTPFKYDDPADAD